MSSCRLCPRKCNVERKNEKGFCRMGDLPMIARAAPHFWEEPVISGEKGSGTVFFSGCTMRCVFCQNYEISHNRKGETISVIQLAEIFRTLQNMGVHNINLVSATQFTDEIIMALEIFNPAIPVVWNSSGYENEETIEKLSKYVDVWLPDFKYAFDEIGEKYSSASNYPKIAIKAISKMIELSPENIIENGLMKKGVIIRHLILPENTRNSIAVLKLIKENFPENTLVSLMAQYIPFGKANEIRELKRKITSREYEKVCMQMLDLGIDGFVQERSSAKEGFVPDWNYKV